MGQIYHGRGLYLKKKCQRFINYQDSIKDGCCRWQKKKKEVEKKEPITFETVTEQYTLRGKNSKVLGKVFLTICHVQQQRGEHMKVQRVVVP